MCEGLMCVKSDEVSSACTHQPDRCTNHVILQLELHQRSCGHVSLWETVLTIALLSTTQPVGVSAVSKPSIGTAYLYSVLIFVFPLIGAIALVHSNRVAIQVQIRLRAQLTSAVYLKALRLSSRCPVTVRRAAVMPCSCSRPYRCFVPV